MSEVGMYESTQTRAVYCQVGLKSTRLVSLKLGRIFPLALTGPKLSLGHVLLPFPALTLIFYANSLLLNLPMYFHTYGVENHIENYKLKVLIYQISSSMTL